MDKKEKKEETREEKYTGLWYGTRGKDGKIFPIPMTKEEFDYYQKLCEEEKNSEK